MDDFSILAVEKCLLEPLAIIFCPQVVDLLADDIVEKIAAEDESSKLEREQLQQKRSKLHESLLQLHRLDRHNVSGEAYTNDLANLRLSKCIVPKESDEDLGDGSDGTDDIGSLTYEPDEDHRLDSPKPPPPTMAEVMSSPVMEVAVESSRSGKRKKHRSANVWEFS